MNSDNKTPRPPSSDTWRELADLPLPQLGENFTSRVMEHMPQNRPGLWPGLWVYLTMPRSWGFSPLRAVMAGRATRTECAFYFYLAAFGLLVLSLVLAVGLRGFPETIPVWGWLASQPTIWLVLSFVLAVTGWLLSRGGRIGLRIARLAALGFTCLTILNAIPAMLEFGRVVWFRPFIPLVLASVILGAFLVLALRTADNHENRVVRA